jgi:hypothetical protein
MFVLMLDFLLFVFIPVVWATETPSSSRLPATLSEFSAVQREADIAKPNDSSSYHLLVIVIIEDKPRSISKIQSWFVLYYCSGRFMLARITDTWP